MNQRVDRLGVVTAFLCLLSCGDGGTAPSGAARLDGAWSLLAFENSDGSVEAIADTSRYTAAFDGDARLRLRADCNACAGPFSTSGLHLSVGALACTRVACPPGSKSTQYVAAMSQAASYLRHGAQLFVYHPGGRLRFEARSGSVAHGSRRR